MTRGTKSTSGLRLQVALPLELAKHRDFREEILQNLRHLLEIPVFWRVFQNPYFLSAVDASAGFLHPSEMSRQANPKSPRQRLTRVK